MSGDEVENHVVKLRQWDVHYVKSGHGPKYVFCLPGSTGTIWTDFEHQIKGFDKEKFTLIVWDTPGFGKSRPPENDFQGNFYENDAELAHEFMQILNIPKYSLLGWCAGGVSSLIHAAKYPENVEKIVIWGAREKFLEKELAVYDYMETIDVWSTKMLDHMLQVYDKETLIDLWTRRIKTIQSYFKTHPDICSEKLKDIQCPAFIVHGAKDFLIDMEHYDTLVSTIKNCRGHVFPDGKHNIHIRYPEEFNKLVQDFLCEP